MQEYLPKGLIVDLVIPMDEMLSFDSESFLNLIERIKRYSDGILLFSPEAGEAQSLTIQEKNEILKRLLYSASENIPLFVYITEDTEDDTKRNIIIFQKTIKEASYSGKIFWVDSPLYYHGNRGLPSMYHRMTAISSYPFVLYNNPKIVEKVKGHFRRKNIRTSVLKKLSKIEKIAGLIFFGSIKRALNYQRAVKERASFRIYDGDEGFFLDYPNKTGVVSVSANLVPHVWKEIIQIDEEKDNLSILEKGTLLKRLYSIIKKNPVKITKELLKRKGIIRCSFCKNEEKIKESDIKEAEDIIRKMENEV